ncbi:hypothetical protein GNP84_09115 [Aliivibrio fischeri]|uniref:EpsG family protein n=1 Tax=Aliivibrio fischeri TaxID=668 RepID=UPI0012D8CE04|nr:EpsG family protein [Aliivibrio fischeri]MUK77053.1 hypothetical protein [Aliivibrio fischeri]
MYWIYSFIILFLLFLLSNRFSETLKVNIFLIVFFIATSGSYYNGVDWVNYIYTYSSFYKNDFNQLAMLYEPGYLGLVYFFSRFFEDMHVLYVFNAFVWVVFFFCSRNVFIELKANQSLFLLIVYITMGNLLFSGAIRQSFSCVIILFCFLYGKNISRSRWFFLICISSLFHFSALLLMPFYSILKLELNRFKVKYFVIFYTLSLLFFLLMPFYYQFLDFIPIIGKKIANSFDRGAQIKIGITIIIDIVAVVFLIYIRRKISNVHSILWYSSLIYFSMHSIFMTFPYAQRLSMYFFPMMILFMVANIKKKHLIGLFSFCIITVHVFIAFKDINHEYFSYPYNNPWFYYYTPNLGSYEIENRAYHTCLVIDLYDERFCRKFMVLGL